jgi:hypothetical protein
MSFQLITYGVRGLCCKLPLTGHSNNNLLHIVLLYCALLRRLARLRWRNAFAVLGTWSRQSTIQSGGQRSSKAPGQLLATVWPCSGVGQELYA